MFNNKIFLFIFCLQLGATEENNCLDWFVHFNTKFDCLEYFKTAKKTSTTITTTTTTEDVSERVTTIEMPFEPTSLPTIPPMETTTTSTKLTTSTEPGRVTTVEIPFEPTSLPPIEPAVSSTTTTTISISYSTITVTEANATSSGRQNRTPWWLSLWAVIIYW